MNSPLKDAILFVLLATGIGCLMWAKVSFQQRQQNTPDNAWSDREDLIRKIGYGILIVDVIIAGFINF